MILWAAAVALSVAAALCSALGVPHRSNSSNICTDRYPYWLEPVLVREELPLVQNDRKNKILEALLALTEFVQFDFRHAGERASTRRGVMARA